MDSGALYGLCARGTQDVWMNKMHPENFNAKLKLLKDVDYQRTYMKLKCDRTTRLRDENIHISTFTIKRQCDLIHNVDMYIAVTDDIRDKSIDEIVHSIEIRVAGQRVDKISRTIKTVIDTNAAIFRSSRTTDKRADSPHIIIPLHMAPFHDFNLACPSLAHHNIDIEVCSPYDLSTNFYAECYYVDNCYRRKEILELFQEFVTIQNAYYHDETHVVKKGVNKFKLYFNHPMHCMYFWGFDKTKVRNIKLCLNYLQGSETKPYFYDDGIAPLERYKQSIGLGNVEPVIICFSNMDFYNKPASTINFSRLDNPALIIETDQEEETPIYFVGLNVQGYKTINGMMGLVYAK